MSFVSPLHPQMLDVFCPMHVAVNETGHITHVGPTIRTTWRRNCVVCCATARRLVDWVRKGDRAS